MQNQKTSNIRKNLQTSKKNQKTSANLKEQQTRTYIGMYDYKLLHNNLPYQVLYSYLKKTANMDITVCFSQFIHNNHRASKYLM